MEFSELVLRRESCRAYADKPVAREDILACIEAARLAPSACNSQPWRFVLVDEPDKRAAVAEYVLEPTSGMNRFAASAAGFLVILEGKAILSAGIRVKIEDQRFAGFDIGGSVAYFTLAAADKGLGTCILGWYDEPKLQALLDIPQDTHVLAVVAYGWPKTDTPRKKARKEAGELYGLNRFGGQA